MARQYSSALCTRAGCTVCFVAFALVFQTAQSLECARMHGCLACSHERPSTAPSSLHQAAVQRIAAAIRPRTDTQTASDILSSHVHPAHEEVSHRWAALDAVQHHARGLRSIFDGGLARLFGVHRQSKQATVEQQKPQPNAGSMHNTKGRGATGNTAQPQIRTTGGTTGAVTAKPMMSIQPAAGLDQRLHNGDPILPDEDWWLTTSSAAYTHSWKPPSPPGHGEEGDLRPPAQVLMQAPQQPLTALTSDPKDFSGPHPWDVLLFKTNQFNTTQPAYRLGGLGLMLMTDFNNSKPLTDWHELASDPHTQTHSMKPLTAVIPAGASATHSFVEGKSLVKPELAQVQRPANPYSTKSTGVQQPAAHMHPGLLAWQQKQQQAVPQESTVGVAAVGSHTGLSSSRLPGADSSSSGPSQSPQGSSRPESMVGLLKKAVQARMRLAGPAQPPNLSSSSSSSSSSNGDGADGNMGGIATITKEATQLWCTACQAPAYQLSPLGFCVCSQGYGRLVDSSNPYACSRCPAGHISVMTDTLDDDQGLQEQAARAVQTCKPCPRGQAPDAAQAACELL